MTFRDRTSEFITAARSLQSRQTNGAVGFKTSAKNRSNPSFSEFMRIAKLIGKDLSSTYSKLEKLTLLAKRKSLFDDRPLEIQELTYIIRQDITSLNKQIAQLQELARTRNATQNSSSKNAQSHSANVVVSLQSKLASMSSEFKQVLEVRTENLKAQRSRRDQFSQAPVATGLPPSALTGFHQGSVLLADEEQAQSNGSVAIDMGVVNNSGLVRRQQQLVHDESEHYLQSRTEAVQSIESTIVELGGIFQQLAFMVREQEEMVQRIDANVDDAHLNVEAAHSELLRYFQSVTSNRWLMLKIFGVLFIFIIIFAVLFA